jgi:glucans biosynthesis protein
MAGVVSALATQALFSGRPLAQELQSSGLVLSDPTPFSFDILKAKAAEMSRGPWHSPTSPYADILYKIDYNAFFQIEFRKDHSLWGDAESGPPVQLFHLGRYCTDPCKIWVSEGGEAREILYRQSYFTMPANHIARQLPEDIGFAGFRFTSPDQTMDWIAFLGASYFRSSGAGRQYGQSARGLAIDTGLATPEEFPRFTAFWLEAVPGERQRAIIYALLDSPSTTGAFRFDTKRDDGVVMDVEMELYPRKPIGRLGVAPLTSMFWYSELNRTIALDWRPEIHDTDGLAIWTGAGERIWRPLNDPPRVMTNSFFDENPKGFGLLQRDRNFDHFQDDGVFYDLRPSVWIEPVGDWGRGSVQLVELPTVDEIHDNIVAYWVPEEPVVVGRPLPFKYRLHWNYGEPLPSRNGTVVANYVGVGGNPGEDRQKDIYRFIVDFTGGKLAQFGRTDGVETIVSASRGEVARTAAYPVVTQPGLFRALFDLKVTGSDPVDLRLFMKIGDEALTETWISQFFPTDSGSGGGKTVLAE